MYSEPPRKLALVHLPFYLRRCRSAHKNGFKSKAAPVSNAKSEPLLAVRSSAWNTQQPILGSVASGATVDGFNVVAGGRRATVPASVAGAILRTGVASGLVCAQYWHRDSSSEGYTAYSLHIRWQNSSGERKLKFEHGDWVTPAWCPCAWGPELKFQTNLSAKSGPTAQNLRCANFISYLSSKRQSAAPGALCALSNFVAVIVTLSLPAVITNRLSGQRVASSVANTFLPKFYAMAAMWTLNSRDDIRSAAANNPAMYLDPRTTSGGKSGPEVLRHLGAGEVEVETSGPLSIKSLTESKSIQPNLQQWSLKPNAKVDIDRFDGARDRVHHLMEWRISNQECEVPSTKIEGQNPK
ncbi:hypothetical protein B0H13DRAFT_1912023 [Mycena leptocephala]|nr:hypothetical protein B0H13DRAFT_1912023 [Mycena leptocephala]